MPNRLTEFSDFYVKVLEHIGEKSLLINDENNIEEMF